MTADVVTYHDVARWLRAGIVREIEESLGWVTDHGTVAGYQRERRLFVTPCIQCRRAAEWAYKLNLYDGND